MITFANFAICFWKYVYFNKKYRNKTFRKINYLLNKTKIFLLDFIGLEIIRKEYKKCIKSAAIDNRTFGKYSLFMLSF